MSEQPPELAILFRVAAIELILADTLVALRLAERNPLEAAKEHRKHFMKVLDSVAVPGLNAALSDYTTGETAEAADRILGEVENLVGRYLAKQQKPGANP